MITFNPTKKRGTLSYEECLDPAMQITTLKEAQHYLAAYVKYLEQYADNHPTKTAEQVAKDNLGYWAGYFGNEARERIERLFNCEHPVFGRIAENGPPTPEEALQCGQQRKTLKELRSKKR